MQTKIQKSGKNFALKVPVSFGSLMNFKQDESVDPAAGYRQSLVTPGAEKKYSLEMLLSGITEDNLHEEFDTGDPVGKEFL
jgi:antitoxin MazE